MKEKAMSGLKWNTQRLCLLCLFGKDRIFFSLFPPLNANVSVEESAQCAQCSCPELWFAECSNCLCSQRRDHTLCVNRHRHFSTWSVVALFCRTQNGAFKNVCLCWLILVLVAVCPGDWQWRDFFFSWNQKLWSTVTLISLFMLNVVWFLLLTVMDLNNVSPFVFFLG